MRLVQHHLAQALPLGLALRRLVLRAALLAVGRRTTAAAAATVTAAATGGAAAGGAVAARTADDRVPLILPVSHASTIVIPRRRKPVLLELGCICRGRSGQWR